MAFFREKKELTLTEQAEGAVARITDDIAGLHEERLDALSCFRCTAEWLDEINQQLGEKAALCGSLVAQLTRAQENISQQVSDNAKVRDKILEIIGG